MNIKPFPKNKILDTQQVLAKRGDNITHGDLLIVRCNKEDLPANFTSLPDCPNGILALGEFTGHAHKLELEPIVPFTVIEGGQLPLSDRVTAKMVSPEEIYLDVKDTVLLKHQEHNFMRFYPGQYEVGIQVERNPWDDQIRALRD